MQIKYIPGRFELGTTLSWPMWSVNQKQTHLFDFTQNGSDTKDPFHLTELTGQTGHLEGLIPQRLQINTVPG